MPLEQGPGVFVQRLSIWKTLGIELFLVAGAALPLRPNFSNGLVYTAFFYKMPFFILLVAACVVLGLMALAFLLFVWRAVLRVPVLTINDKTITVLRMRPRTVDKSDVAGLVRIWPGVNINLQIRGQPPLALPIGFYEEPQLTLNLLEPLVSEPDGARATGR
jgi:hypothetical protein